MTLSSYSIPNLIQGISQQSDAQRDPTQGERLALNVNNTPVAYTGMVCQIYHRGVGFTTAQSATLRTLNNAYIAAIAAA
jgi:hypothetical protein